MPDQIYGVSWNGTERVNYTYDGLGRLTNKQIKPSATTALNNTYTYEDVENTNKTTTLVKSVETAAGTYTYTYDAVGNIISINDGTYTTSYEYDNLNQLVRENDQKANTTTTYTYTNGNITERKDYAYTTGTLGELLDTKTWQYGDSTWGDLLTNFNGQQITYDTIGNPITINDVSLSWEGRQLKQVVDGNSTYAYQYNADGQRVSKSVNGVTTNFIYNGSILAGQTTGNDKLTFMYDNNGETFGFTYNGTDYFYIKNAQNDVTAIADTTGEIVCRYYYDAWGNLLDMTGSLAGTIGNVNPIRYRSYYFDSEINMYYLNSRYYSPDLCRFLNADGIYDTNTGMLSHNMFTYCNNNPVNMIDSEGTGPIWNKVKSIYKKIKSWLFDEPNIDNSTNKVDKVEAIDDIVNIHKNVQNEMRTYAEHSVNKYSGKNKRNELKYNKKWLEPILPPSKKGYNKLISFQNIELEGCFNFQIEGKEWSELKGEEQDLIAQNLKAWDPVAVDKICIAYGISTSEDIWEIANG